MTAKNNGFRVGITDLITTNLLVEIVVIFVIATKRYHRTLGKAVREENLRSCIDPNAALGKLREIGCQIEAESFRCTGQSDAANEQHEQREVG